MKTITLSNSFHGTEARVRVPDDVAARGEREAWYWIQSQVYAGWPTDAAKAKLRRVRRTLCGFSGCNCGTVR